VGPHKSIASLRRLGARLLVVLAMLSPFVGVRNAAAESMGEAVDRALRERLQARFERASALSRDDRCEPRFAGLGSESALSLSLVLGVLETAGAVSWDRPVAQSLDALLTEPCSTGQWLCQFERASDGRFVRTVAGRNVKLNVVTSSAADTRHEALGPLAARQAQATRDASRAFLNALENDDVVLFVGHSRFGSGLGFDWFDSPSRRWFDTFVERKDLEAMKDTLARDETPPSFIGVLGCSTERYYGRALGDVTPGENLLLSTAVTDHLSNVADAVAVMNAIVGSLCIPQERTVSAALGLHPAYRLYGPAGDAQLPTFPAPLTLPHLVLLLCALAPIILFVAARAPRVPGLAKKRAVFAALSWILAVVLAARIATYLAGISSLAEREAIPLLFLAAGGLALPVLVPWVRSAALPAAAEARTVAAAAALVALLYLALLMAVAPEPSQLLFAAKRLLFLTLRWLSVLPYAAATTLVLLAPVYLLPDRSPRLRAALFALAAVLFAFVASKALIFVSFWLPPLAKDLFVLHLGLAFLAVALYRLPRPSLIRPILFLSLAHGLVLAEDFHHLFV
jgi:hypothetical protein